MLLPLLSSIYVYLHLSTSTFIYLRLPSSIYVYLHLSTSTFIFMSMSMSILQPLAPLPSSPP
uniref:Ovule protein n=1 Tax=Heterorhabditis bacteriophora TaxID=37862 RepID=A0A1I7XLB5_HETBA